MKNNSLPRKAVLAAVLCNMLFGSASPSIKLGYELFEVGDDLFKKILFAGVRFFLSGIIVFAVTAVKDRHVPVIHRWNRFNVCSVALFYTFLQYLFFYVGVSNTSGASGSIVSTSAAFIAVIFAHFVYKNDKINGGKLLGILLGFSGVLFATLANDTVNGFSLKGEGLVLVSATCFVVGSMLNKRATRESDSFTVTAYNLLIGGGMLVVLGLLGGGGNVKISLGGVLVLLYLCMVSSVGFTVWSLLVKKYPIGSLSVFNFVIPLSGTLLSALILKENVLRWQYLLALVLVSAGILFVNRGTGGLRKKDKKATEETVE